MAFTRIQASAKTNASNITSINHYMVTPPAIGSGLIVFVNTWNAAANIPKVTDNRGNLYSLAVNQVNGVTGCNVYYCPSVVATGGPFIITCETPNNVYWAVLAIEVGNVGIGLAVDQFTKASGSSTAPATGATAPLTSADSFQVAAMAVGSAQSSIAVGASTPTWFQEFEELPSTFIPGEGDSRIVTGSATGTTPSASWTNNTSGNWSAVVVAFKIGVASTGVRVSQDALELLERAPAQPARVSQYAVELIGKVGIAKAWVTSLTVETLIQPIPKGRVSQMVVEVLSLPSTKGRVTQMTVESIQFDPQSPSSGAGIGPWMGESGGSTWIE